MPDLVILAAVIAVVTLTQGLVIPLAIITATVTGLFTVFNLVQRGRIDQKLATEKAIFERHQLTENARLNRELQWDIAHLGMMKSAFDISFKEEFAAYKVLWPALQNLILEIPSSVDEMMDKTLNRSPDQRAKLIMDALDPVATSISESSFYLPKDIRERLEDIQSNAAQSYLKVNGGRGEKSIFQPDCVEALDKKLVELRDMIADRVRMIPKRDGLAGYKYTENERIASYSEVAQLNSSQTGLSP